MAAVAEGEKAPEFALQDATGRPFGLKDFAGRDLLLFFYPADDTPG